MMWYLIKPTDKFTFTLINEDYVERHASALPIKFRLLITDVRLQSEDSAVWIFKCFI